MKDLKFEIAMLPFVGASAESNTSGAEEIIDDLQIGPGTEDVDVESQSESSYESSSSEVEEGEFKRRRNRNYILIVPRADIRRKYPQMLVNILNMQSVPLLYSFFVTYSSHDLVCRHQLGAWKFSDIATANYLTSPLTCTTYRGPLYMIMYFAILLQLIPDEVVRLKSGTIRTSSVRSTTEIECDMQWEFTLLYQVNPMQLSDVILQHIDNQSIEENCFKAFLATSIQSDSANSPIENRRGKKSRKKMSIQKTTVVSSSNDLLIPNTFEYSTKSMNNSIAVNENPHTLSISFKLKLLIDSLRRILCIEILDPRFV